MNTTDMTFHNTLLNSSMRTIWTGKRLFASMCVVVSEEGPLVVIHFSAKGASNPQARPPFCHSPPQVAIL